MRGIMVRLIVTMVTVVKAARFLVESVRTATDVGISARNATTKRKAKYSETRHVYFCKHSLMLILTCAHVGHFEDDSCLGL